MFRKMLKKCYLLVAVLLMVGGICLLPSRTKELNGTQQSGVSSAAGLTPTSTSRYGETVYIIPGDNIVDVNNPSKNVYGGYYLEAIAESIKNGESTYVNASIYLEGDIDLGGGRQWIPIGIYGNPFKGSFYGNGHKISNIMIDERAVHAGSDGSKYYGLFGYIEGATIADVRISGEQSFNPTTTPTAAGTLVGYAKNSAIINCYEESTIINGSRARHMKIGVDGTPTELKSIGKCEGTTYYSNKKTSYSGTYTASDVPSADSSEVDVETGSLANGLVATLTVSQPSFNNGITGAFGFYRIKNDGAQEFYNPYDPLKQTSGTTKGIRVLLKEDGSFDDGGPSKARFFLSKAPVYREDVNKDNYASYNDRVFALKEGTKLPNTYKWTAVNAAIALDKDVPSAVETVTLNAGYGGENGVGSARTATITNYPYDMSFLTYFKLYPGYVRRLGYTFTGMSEGATYNNANSLDLFVSGDTVKLGNERDWPLPLNFLKQFPHAGKTYTMGWASTEEGRGLSVRLARASDEGGNFTKVMDIDKGRTEISLSSQPSSDDFTKYIDYKTNATITADTFTFTITLQAGYRISFANFASTNTGTTSNQEGITIGASAPFLTNVKSGAYPCFNAGTGKDAAYVTAGKNYDSYYPTYVTGEWTNKNLTNNNLTREYKFTVGNIVGADGIIYLVVERDWLTVDVTPTKNTSLSNATTSGNLQFTWTLLQSKSASASEDTRQNLFFFTSSKDATTGSSSIENTNGGQVFLKIRRLETPAVKFNLTDGNFIIAIGAQTLTSSPYDEGPSNSGTNPNQVLKQGTSTAGYFPTWIFDIIANPDNSDFNNIANENHKIQLICGTLRTWIHIIATADGTSQLEQDIGGLGVFINNWDSANIPEGGQVNIPSDLFSISTSNHDEIYVLKNGKYKADSFEVFKGNSTADGDQIDTGNFVDGGDRFSYWTGASENKRIFQIAAGSDNAIKYTLRIHFIEQTYATNFKYMVKQDKGDPIEITNTSLLFGAVPDKSTYSNCKPSDPQESPHRTISFTLSEVGKGVLAYDNVEVSGSCIFSQGPKDKSSISRNGEGVATDGTYNFTFNPGYHVTTITFYFTFKTVDFNIDTLWYKGEGDGRKITGAMDPILKTFRFACTEDGQSLSLQATEEQNGTKIDAISIDSQYYLLGWYISAGKIYLTGAFDTFMSDQGALQAIAKALGTNLGTSNFKYNDLMPNVGLRTVHVNYKADNVGNGAFYDSTKTKLTTDDAKIVSAGSITWNWPDDQAGKSTSFDINSNVFFNIGHTLSGYTTKYSTLSGLINGSFSLGVENFADIFNIAVANIAHMNGNRTVWEAFIAETDDDEHNYSGYREKTIDLVTAWTVIDYIFQIDTREISSTIKVNVGDQITFEIDAKSKNGNAYYYLKSNGSTQYKMERREGDELQGYVAVGFKIYMIKDAIFGEYNLPIDATENDGKKKFETLDALNAETLAKILYDSASGEDFRFSVNSEDKPIKIVTLRDPAKYYLILKSSPYYTYELKDKSTGRDVAFIDDDGNAIIIATFDAKPTRPETLFNVIRNGYEVRSEDIGSSNKLWIAQGTNEKYDFEAQWKDTTDITIYPAWIRTSQTTETKIEKTTDADGHPENDTYYLGYAHDFLNGLLKEGANVRETIEDKEVPGATKPGNVPSNAGIDNLLINGEYIRNYYFKISFKGEELPVVSKQVLNLTDLNKGAGEYTITFVIVVDDGCLIEGYKIKDGLPGDYATTYEMTAAMTITLAQNTIEFFDQSLHTIYTGTDEFVPVDGDAQRAQPSYTELNSYGSFYFKYYWNGKTLSTVDKQGDVHNGETPYFKAFKVVDTTFEVGENKTLRMYLNSNFSDRIANNTNFAQVFNNVASDEAGYYVDRPTLKIEQAKFTIDLKAKVFIIPNVETKVSVAREGNITVGKSTFKYNLSEITLLPGRTARLAKDHAVDSEDFKVYDLIINDVRDNKNFEWNLSGTVEILDEKNALKLTYTVGYLTATNGALNEITSDYESQHALIKLTSVSIAGNKVTFKGDGDTSTEEASRDSFFYVEDSSLTSYFAYNYDITNNKLTVYINETLINKATLAYTLKADSTTVTVTEKGNFKLFGVLQNPILVTTNTIKEDIFANSRPSYDDYTYSFDTTGGTSTLSLNGGGDYQMLLSDVVKVDIDYDGGHVLRDNEVATKNPLAKREVIKETIYVSSTEKGSFTNDKPSYNYDYLDNGTYTYNGVEFSSYQMTGSYLTISQSNDIGPHKFMSTQGGRTVSVIANWEFKELVVSANNTTITMQAAKNALTLNLSEMVNLTLPNSYAKLQTDILKETYTLTKNDDSGVSFVADHNQIFTIVDNNNFVTTDLTGDYTLTLVVLFKEKSEDKAPTKATTPFTIHLEIKINVLNVSITAPVENGENKLQFNNTEREGEITLTFTTVEGCRHDETTSYYVRTLSEIEVNDVEDPKSNITAKTYINADGGKGASEKIRYAQKYIIELTIKDAYQKIFEFADVAGNKSIKDLDFEIYKYEIDLDDYASVITPSKMFGEEEPEHITYWIEIKGNAKYDNADHPTNAGDIVWLWFDRETPDAEGHNEIGQYNLSNPRFNEDDSARLAYYRQNYSIKNPEEFTGKSKFTINNPNTDILIELQDHLTYIYNGGTLSSISAEYINDTEYGYKLSGKAGSEEVSVYFKMYYKYRDEGGTEKTVLIPSSERGKYAREYLSFTVNNHKKYVGKYTVSVALAGDAAPQSGGGKGLWLGVKFVNGEKAEVEVTPRPLIVTGATKVFDGNEKLSFTKQDDVISGNCIFTFAELDIANHTGYIAGDKVTIQGNITGDGKYESFKRGDHLLSLDTSLAKGIAITNLGDEEDGHCYTLQIQEGGANITITPAKKAVALAGKPSLTYGEISAEGGAGNADTARTGIYGEGTSVTAASIAELLALVYTSDDYVGIVDPIDHIIAHDSFKVTNIQIVDAKYSTGGYLKVGTYQFIITVISSDFTFEDEDITRASYTKNDYKLSFEITQREITISNTDLSMRITKQFDGFASLPAALIDTEVDKNGYLISGESKGSGRDKYRLAGDILKISNNSHYSDDTIENNKIITIIFADDDDHLNYNITWHGIKLDGTNDNANILGDITSIVFKFRQVIYDYDFVDDGVKAPEGKIFEIEYSDNRIESLIDNIYKIEDGKYTFFATRQGYHQIRFEYCFDTPSNPHKGTSLEEIKKDSTLTGIGKEFLIAAAAATVSGEGLPLDVIWAKDVITITIIADTKNENTKITWKNTTTSDHGEEPVKGEVEITAEYFDSFEVSLSIIPGYKIVSIAETTAFTIKSGYLTSKSGETTRTGNFVLTNVQESDTVNVTIEEIVVTVKLDYHYEGQYFQHTLPVKTEGPEAANAFWKDEQQINGELYKMEISYSNLKVNYLPFPHTVNELWAFTGWEDVEDISVGLWTLINGENFVASETQDRTFSYTATWKLGEFKLTISSEEGSPEPDEIKVATVKEGEPRKLIDKNEEGVYILHYTDNFIIFIKGKAFYKFDQAKLTLTTVSATPETSYDTVNTTQHGNFTDIGDKPYDYFQINDVRTDIAVVINYIQATITITTDAAAGEITDTIEETSPKGNIGGDYTLGLGDITISEFFKQQTSAVDRYTCERQRTYYQSGWTYKKDKAATVHGLEENLQTLITKLLGYDPYQDETIDLHAYFKGYTYDVTFEIGEDFKKDLPDVKFTGDDAGKPTTTTRQIEYGILLEAKDIPELASGDAKYIWAIGEGEDLIAFSPRPTNTYFLLGTHITNSDEGVNPKITLSARRGLAEYKVKIEISGHIDQLEKLMSGEDNVNLTVEGDKKITDQFDIINRTDKSFTFTLKTGYTLKVNEKGGFTHTNVKINDGKRFIETFSINKADSSNVEDVIVIKIEIVPKTYTIKFSTDSRYETVKDKQSRITEDNTITINYDQTGSEVFGENLTFERGGYVIAKLVVDGNINDVFAEYSTSDCKVFTIDYNSKYFTSGVYKWDRTDDDLTWNNEISVSIVWQLKDDILKTEEGLRYIEVIPKPVGGIHYYNEHEQEIVNSSITENGVEITGLNNLINGEIITAIYYEITYNGTPETKKVEDFPKFALKYTNSTANRKIKVYIVIKDQLLNVTTPNSTGARTRIVETQITNDKGIVNERIKNEVGDELIRQARIVIKDASIEGYYTASPFYWPTANEYHYGTLYYYTEEDGKQFEYHVGKLLGAQLLSVEKVEFIDNEEKYNVKNNYEVKYFFKSGAGFDSNNFANLENLSDNEYTYVTGKMPVKGDEYHQDYKAVYGNIVKAQIVLEFNESGFYNGNTQAIQSFEQTINSLTETPDGFVGKLNYSVLVTKIITTGIGNEHSETKYGEPSEFNFTWTLTLPLNGDSTENTNGNDNFIFKFTEGTSYTIISADLAYAVTFDAQYFSISNANAYSNGEINKATIGETENFIKILSFTYDDETITINVADKSKYYNKETFNYYSKTHELIMTVTGNGSKGLSVLILNGKSVTFNLSTDDEGVHVLDWGEKVIAASERLEGLKTKLEGLEKEEENENVLTPKIDTPIDYVAVLTDYVAVRLNYRDEVKNGTDLDKITPNYVYIKIGETITLPNADNAFEEWVGFRFVDWWLSPSQTKRGFSVVKEVEDFKLSYSQNSIIRDNIYAQFELCEPEVEGNAHSFKAHFEMSGDEAKEKVYFSSIWKDGEIKNYNPDDIRYDYIIYKDINGDGKSTQDKLDYVGGWTSDGSGIYFNIPANTNSNGKYVMQVIVYRNSPNPNVENLYITEPQTFTEITFDLTVELLTIEDVSMVIEDANYNANNAFTYKNGSFNNDIKFNFTLIQGDIDILGRDIGDEQIFGDLLDKENESSYYFTLSGKASYEIKLAGDYTITLHLNPTIFNAKEVTFPIKVNPYTISINEDDIETWGVNSKTYGDEDPQFVGNKNMYKVIFEGEDREETVYISLSRDSGESRGLHRFTRVYLTTDSSLNGSAETGNLNNYVVEFAGDLYFTIEALEGTLTLTLKDNKTLTKIYDGNGKFELNYDEINSRWMINFGDDSSEIKLTYQKDGASPEIEITNSNKLYLNALTGLNIYTNAYEGDPSHRSYDVISGSKALKYDGESAFSEYVLDFTYTITQRTILADIEKVFDATATFRQANVTFTNLCAVDEGLLYFDGKDGQAMSFVDADNVKGAIVGEHNVDINTITLGGDRAHNYQLADSYLGTITRYIIRGDEYSQVKFSEEHNTFKYGEIYQGMNPADIISYIVFNVEGLNGNLIDFVEIKEIKMGQSDGGDILSSSECLKVGKDRSVRIILQSDNIDLSATGDSYIVNLNVNQRELDLSYLTDEGLILKKYNGEKDLKLDDWTIDLVKATGLDRLASDKVEIDESLSYYEYAEVGTWNVTIMLKDQDDAENYYIVIDPSKPIQGIITQYQVEVTVNPGVEDPELVPNGKFVEDLVSSPEKFSFKVSYPFDITSGLPQALIFPQRQGYIAETWRYAEGGHYLEFNVGNINDVLKSAVDKNEEEPALDLFIQWKIEDFTIGYKEIFGDEEDPHYIYDFTVVGDSVTGDKENGYKAEYFSNVTITIKTIKGYKIESISEDVNIFANEPQFKNLEKKSELTLTLEKITGENILGISISDIMITLEINDDYDSLVALQTLDRPNYAPISLAYRELIDRALPIITTTKGTYVLAGYDLGGKEISLDYGWQKLVDDQFPNIAEDQTIRLKAKWIGVEYTITFNADNEFYHCEEVLEPMKVRFGEQLGELPDPAREGMKARWYALKNVFYSDTIDYNNNDFFYSIGSADSNSENGGYKITFLARWEYVPYKITINFDDKIFEISVNNNPIPTGTTYGENGGVKYTDVLTLNVKYLQRGYVIAFSDPDNTFPGVVTVDNEVTYTVAISRLTADAVLNLIAESKPYTLSIIMSKDQEKETIEGYTISEIYPEGTEITKTDNRITAHNGQYVIIRFTPKKGYEFDLNNNAVAYTGGKLSFVDENDESTLYCYIDEDTRELVCKWYNLSALDSNAITLVVTTVPRDLKITFEVDGNINPIYALNGNDGKSTTKIRDPLVDGYSIKMGKTLKISGELLYGYMGISVETKINGSIIEGIVGKQTSEYDSISKRYVFSFEFAGFDDDLTIKFICTPRSYTFKLMIEDETLGKIADGIDSIQVVEYGKSLKVGQIELVPTYRFAGWYIGGERISLTPNGELLLGIGGVITSSHLENPDGEYIYVVAKYELKTMEEGFKVTGNGSITVSQDENSLDVLSGEDEIKFAIVQGKNIKIKLNPDLGYEFNALLFDGIITDPNDYYSPDEENTLIIPIDLFNPVEHIEISFKASDATIIVQSSISISNIRTVGTIAGGKILISDENGNKLEDSIYKPYNNDLLIGGNYTIASHTDEELHFVIEPKEGFTPSVITTQGVTINAVTKNGVLVYTFRGLKDKYQIEVVFTAKENTINIHFEVEGKQEFISAGRIEVDTSSNMIKSSPRNVHYTNVGIITGENLVFDLYIYPSFNFEIENNTVKYRIIYGGTETFAEGSIKVGDIKSCDLASIGFSNMVSFSVENVNTDAQIIFYVVPKEFSIEFEVLEGSPRVEMSKKIIFGEQWSLHDLTENEKGRILATRPNFTFIGYFTNPSGVGKMIIDRYGEVLNVWEFSGYSPDGSGKYVHDFNYDPESDTFTLYAAWIYNTADIEVRFAPSNITDDYPQYSIETIVTNFRDLDSWVKPQENKWLATISAGARINISAINFEGYVFDKFTLQFETNELVTRPATFQLELETGSYILTAYYRPTVTITIVNTNNDLADGGRAYAKQDGNDVGNSFDPQKFLSIVAQANEGFNFVKWQRLQNGMYVDLSNKGELNAAGEYVYTFDLITEPVSLIAYFEGKPVALTFDDSEIKDYHEIISKQINGAEFTLNETIAHVGDLFTVSIYKLRGFNFDIENTSLTLVSNTNGIYTFECRLTSDVLEAVNSSSYQKVIKIKLVREELSFEFTYIVENQVDDDENTRAGYVNIMDTSGNVTKINNNGLYVRRFGESFSVSIVENPNYDMLSISLRIMIEGIGMQRYMLEPEDGLIVFNEEFEKMYFAYQFFIEVTFKHLQWDDEEIVGSLFEIKGEGEEAYVDAQLSGKGTEEDPYQISSVNDFALMAYLVNNGYKNEAGLKFSDANYVVVNNIDFASRFWIPIGTEENPFNGYIDLGKYEFLNIEHIKTYKNPSTSHRGLFWHIGENGEVDEDKSILLTIMLSIFIPLIVLIILLIILLIWRKKKKEDLNDISNQ